MLRNPINQRFTAHRLLSQAFFMAAAAALFSATAARADIFDNNSTTAGFGVTNGSTYDWWGTGLWSDGALAANDAGTAATVTWQGTSLVSEQAFFVGSGVAGENYTVRLGSTGATDTYIQNLGLNVNAAGSGALAGAAGNVTIGNTGDAGLLILRAANSFGAQNSGTLTVNNGINLNAFTTNFRGGNVVLNGSISGTGTSNISSGSGAFGLTSGTLTLAGDNSFVGNVTVKSGYIFKLQHANALGATGGTNTVESGGAIEITNGTIIASGESVGIAGNGENFNGALRAGSGGGTWAGGVTLNTTGTGPRLGATAGSTLTITGTIANGSGNSFLFSGTTGTGALVLNPTTSNTYTGTTSIIRGIIRLGKTNALPTGTTLDVDSAGSVDDAATFDMAGYSQTVAVLQDSAGSSINGLITNSAASTTSTLTVNQASNTDFGGIIENGSGSVVLTKGGVGNLTLSGANTFTGGTNIKIGSIALSGGDNRLATTGSVILGDVATSGKLVIGTSSVARTQTLAGLTTTGLGGSVVGAHATDNSTLVLNIASGTNVFDGSLGGAGTNENKLALTKSGPGTLKLTGPNTYSGPTTLTQGTLQVGVDSVGAITSSAIGTGTLTFNGGTLSSDGGTARTIGNAVTFTGNAGLGDATNNGKLTFTNNMDLGATARTITLNSAVQLDGSFTNSAATSGLIKAGTGTLTINAANTSFGNTNGFAITGGTVVAANTAAMGNAGQIVTLSSSGSFGTLDLATDTTANAYVLNFGSVAGAGGNVIVNRANDGAAITHTMGISTFGNAKINVLAGGKVTSGTPTLEFGGITLSAGAGGDGATTFNPTTAHVLISGNITRTGSSANSLVLDGASTGNLISGSISGSQTLTKSNTGTWELSNANTFTGNTKVTGGTLKLTNNLAIQSSAFDTSGAGTLDISTLNTPTFGGLTSATSYVLPSNVTSLTLNPSSGTQTYTGDLSRTGGGTGLTLTKTGAGTQILSGTNSYTGLTTVNGGELRVTTAAAIGGNNVTVTSGQFALDGNITVSGKSLTTSGSGANFVGGLQSVSGTNTWDGSVLLGADLSRLGARRNATLVLSGSIDDGVNNYTAVIRNENQNNTSGAGNATTITELSGVSTYGGNTQLIAGVTRLAGGDNRLPTGTILQFGGSGANAKFDMNGRSQEVAGLAVMSANTDTQRDWNANELTNSSGTLSTLTVNTAADQTFGLTTNNFGGRENYTGIITGNIALAKSGTFALTLSGANTYSQGTSIKNGSLILTGGNDRLLSTGSVVLGDMATSGKLVLGDATTARNQTLAALTSTGLGGSVVGANASTDSVLTLNIASGTGTYGGVLGGGGTNENKLALTKSGAGILALSGSANTYSGATTINAGGALSLGAAGALSSASTVVINGGTLLAGGFSNTGASLSLSAPTGSTIDLNGTSVLTFSGIDAGSFTANTLAVWNWSGTMGGGGTERLMVPDGVLDSTQLGNITFFSGEGSGLLGTAGYSLTNPGELVPVPEPGALATAAVLALAAFGPRRRRR